jgi:hypothetical protein
MLGNITNDGTIKFNVLWPDIGVVHLRIKSAGLADFLQIPSGMLINKLSSKLESL